MNIRSTKCRVHAIYDLKVLVGLFQNLSQADELDGVQPRHSAGGDVNGVEYGIAPSRVRIFHVWSMEILFTGYRNSTDHDARFLLAALFTNQSMHDNDP